MLINKSDKNRFESFASIFGMSLNEIKLFDNAEKRVNFKLKNFKIYALVK